MQIALHMNHMNHLHVSFFFFFFLETSCTTLMRRQASFQSSWRLGSAASLLHPMRPFKKPCQRCCTALIQLRFTSKQDLMCSTVSWMGRTENSQHFKKFVYNSLSKSSNLIDFLTLKTPPRRHQWLFIQIESYY